MRVVITPNETYITLGSRTEFTCIVTSKEPYSIHWSYKAIFRSGLPPKTEIKDKNRLIIHHAMPENEGKYICFASVGKYIKRGVAKLVVVHK